MDKKTYVTRLKKMLNRYGNVQLPEIMCADLTKDTRKKEMKLRFCKGGIKRSFKTFFIC